MLLAVIILTFSGCERDEVDEEVSIEGTWQMTKLVDFEYENDQLIETEEEDIRDWMYVISLNKGKWLASESYADGTLQYSREGTYVRLGNKLTVYEVDDIDEDVSTIKTLTSTTLVLWSESINIEDGVTYKEITEETFKRK